MINKNLLFLKKMMLNDESSPDGSSPRIETVPNTEIHPTQEDLEYYRSMFRQRHRYRDGDLELFFSPSCTGYLWYRRDIRYFMQVYKEPVINKETKNLYQYAFVLKRKQSVGYYSYDTLNVNEIYIENLPNKWSDFSGFRYIEPGTWPRYSPNSE